MAYITHKHTEITGIDLNLSIDEVNLLIGLLLDQQIEISNWIEEAKKENDVDQIDFLKDCKEEVDNLLEVFESTWSE